MKLRSTLSAFSFLLLCGSPAAMAGVKDYQVSGPVVSTSDTMIVVHKDKSDWEIARTSDTKAPADLKVGDNVTVHYTMTAVSVAAKAAKPAKAEKPAKAKASESPAAKSAESPAASPAKPSAEASPAAH